MKSASKMIIFGLGYSFEQNVYDSQQFQLVWLLELTSESRNLSTNNIKHFSEITHSKALQHILDKGNDGSPFQVVTCFSSTHSL